ncbi:MAG: aminopeptidase [archaeon]
MNEGTIKFGAEQAVINCTRVKPDEKVVIITSNDTKHIGYAIRDSAENITPGNVKMFNMEDYGKRPDDGKNPLKFPSEIGEALSEADVSFYAAGQKKGELVSFRVPMIHAVEANEKLRHAHMPGINSELMKTGMAADYGKIQTLTAKVEEIVSQADYIRVTSPAGTDLMVTFNPDYKWLISDGNIKAENWSNLPDGETFTCAYNANGIVVVDGVLGDYMDDMFGIIKNTPLNIEVNEGRIVKTSCDNDKILKEFDQYIIQDENANRLGEFAIGTNIGLDKLVGNILQDEKFPGVHVAFGHGYPEKTGANWESDAHCDVVLTNVTINVEGTNIMTDGKFSDNFFK